MDELTIKDLKCITCTKKETLQCPIDMAMDIGTVKYVSKICGLACHSLALQVLAGPVIAELERLPSRQMSIAIKLLKGEKGG